MKACCELVKLKPSSELMKLNDLVLPMARGSSQPTHRLEMGWATGHKGPGIRALCPVPLCPVS